MGDQAGAAAEQSLRVVLIEEVRGDAQSVFASPGDDRTVDLRGHLGGGAQVVVDSDLDPVRSHGGHGVGGHDGLLGRRSRHDRTRDEQARYAGAVLAPARVAQREGRFAVAAQAVHGRHSEAGVARQFPGRVFPIVNADIEAPGAADVAVRVDQTGDDVPLARIQGSDPGRLRQRHDVGVFRGRGDRQDPTAADLNDRALGHGRTGSVPHVRVIDDEVGRWIDGRPRSAGSQNDRKGDARQPCNPPRHRATSSTLAPAHRESPAATYSLPPPRRNSRAFSSIPSSMA